MLGLGVGRGAVLGREAALFLASLLSTDLELSETASCWGSIASGPRKEGSLTVALNTHTTRQTTTNPQIYERISGGRHLRSLSTMGLGTNAVGQGAGSSLLLKEGRSLRCSVKGLLRSEWECFCDC